MKIKEMFLSELDPAEVPKEWWLERFRNWRAVELSQSDWTQLPDSPADTSKWGIYRQALRDLPSIENFANADIPTRPK